MRTVRIGLIGAGTIGSGVYELIEGQRKPIEHREGLSLEITKVLSLVYPDYIPESKRVSAITDITGDPEIDVVVELIGGIEPAKPFILAALNAGKTVVTANKDLIARHWPELEAAARATGAGLYFEAAVGGGIPLLRTILDSVNSDSIDRVAGIINGTTNYILTNMSESGLSYEQALSEAQAAGYAEQNPASDVEGFDATYKLSILASMAFHARVPMENIYREGITGVTQEDIENARKMGYAIKLLAIGKKIGTRIEARVHPTMIPLTHPLASVRGAFNAVYIHAPFLDDIMLYGRGAGKKPTATAVVSDIIHAANTTRHKYMTFVNEYAIPVTTTFEDNWKCAYYLRIEAEDKSGVLAAIADVFGKCGVSLSSVLQQGHTGSIVPLIFITHPTCEADVTSAMAQIEQLPEVAGIRSRIRVESL